MMNKEQIHSILEIVVVSLAIGAIVFGFNNKLLALLFAAMAVLLNLYLIYQRKFNG